MRATLLLTGAMAVVWLGLSSARAAPQTPNFPREDLPPADGGSSPGPGPQPPAGDPCAAVVTERNGIVTIALDDAARAGQPTTFKLDDITYAAHFDDHGKLDAQGPIFHATAEADWTGAGGKACQYHGIAFGNFESTFMTALVWTAGTFDLALHVVEPPGGRLGGPVGYIYPGRPNLDRASGLGQIRTFGEPVAGTSQIQLYTLPPDNNPRQGEVYFFIEFVTRGNPARPPYCGGGGAATASYKILHLGGGRFERRGGAFGAVDCGRTWAEAQKESEYFQRWKWKL